MRLSGRLLSRAPPGVSGAMASTPMRPSSSVHSTEKNAKPVGPSGTGPSALDGYLDRLGLDTGVLVVFDRRPDVPAIHARTTLDVAITPSGRSVTVLRA